MLKELQIRNFAIVKDLHIEFENGFTSITGETGAGKSVSIDALGLCLGARAEASEVRPGEDRADITAVFTAPEDSAAGKWLEEHALDNGGECILRRQVSREGRSKSLINGSPSTLNELREVSHLLISIHGQHAQQQLLDRDYQLTILDNYGGYSDLLRETAEQAALCRKKKKQLDEAEEKRRENASKLELIRYQAQELKGMHMEKGEYEQVDNEQTRLSRLDELMADTGSCLGLLRDSDGAAASALSQVKKTVQEMAAVDASLGEVVKMLEEAEIRVEESYDEIRAFGDSLETSPGALEKCEKRLSEYHAMAKRHHVAPQDLYSHYEDLIKKYNELRGSSMSVDGYVKELAEAEAAYRDLCARLHDARVSAAERLSSEITGHMKELSMPDGHLRVEVTPAESASYPSRGTDEVSFLVTTNPGQPEGELAGVVSGGELSRIALAIQVINAARTAVPALIFDEVDVGISGPTAAVVGRLMRKLGESTQVIAVTHLPQVAGQGHHQFFVTKTTDGATTETSMRSLTPEERVREIARLLSDGEITENALAQARNLIAV